MGADESHFSKRINKEIQNKDLDFIIEKIKRAQRVKDNKSGNNLPIIAKFTD